MFLVSLSRSMQFDVFRAAENFPPLINLLIRRLEFVLFA